MPIKPSALLRADLIFLVALCVFATLIVLMYHSVNEVGRIRAQQERGYQILRKMEGLLAYAVELETSSRTYVITGNEQYLLPLEIGGDTLEASVDSLRSLIVNEEQKERVDTLEELLKERLRIGQTLVGLRDDQGIDSAIRYVEAGKGTMVMDSLRKVASHAIERELDLLSDRAVQTNQKRARRGTLFLLLVITALVIIGMAYLIIRNNIRSLIQQRKIQETLINELTYQNKQLDDFAHVTSHNIRGPVANMRALMGLLNDKSEVADYKVIFSKLQKMVGNLMDTLHELLKILHVKKHTDLERTPQSFQQVFAKELDNLEIEIKQTKATIEQDFSEAPNLEYPTAYLESIAHNLVSNALKYRAPNRPPVIHIATEKKDLHILLHVRDNGLGIDLGRFGHKLFGLRNTFHEHPDARGVGLFMTKTQVEAMGGKIFVDSKVGEGTTFTVQF